MRTLDLFCGAGGLSLGFQQAGFQTAAAVEIDKFSAKTFSGHTPEAYLVNSDVKEIDFNEYRGKVDIVIGGPPCQPFSTGGLRKAKEDERDMVPEFIRAISKIRPMAFVMENVPGLMTGDRKNYLREIMHALYNLGYEVNSSVLKAEEYGVPQKRRRLFVVGIKNKKFYFPEATHGNYADMPVVAAGEILSDKPLGSPNNSKVFYAKKVDIRPSPYHGLLFNGGGRAIDLSNPAPTIISSAGGNKTHFIDTLGVVPEYHAYLRSGGIPREGEVPGCRRITAKESALIQTFPEEIAFAGPASAQYRQIGNAVPPLLAFTVAKSLKNQMYSDHVIHMPDRESYQYALI